MQNINLTPAGNKMALYVTWAKQNHSFDSPWYTHTHTRHTHEHTHTHALARTQTHKHRDTHARGTRVSMDTDFKCSFIRLKLWDRPLIDHFIKNQDPIPLHSLNRLYFVRAYCGLRKRMLSSSLVRNNSRQWYLQYSWQPTLTPFQITCDMTVQDTNI